MSNKIVLKRSDGSYVDNPEIEGLKIDFFGQNNLIELEEGSVFHNVQIKCRESCHIKIGKTHPRGLRHTAIDMAGSRNAKLFIGQGTSIESARFAMANDNDLFIQLGEGCMLSSNITFRSTDGHVIYSVDSKQVLNKTKPIIIGDRVWIGSGAVILKGSKVSDDSIIGTMALVAKSFEETNIVVAGNPAKIVKTGILWDRTYIKNWSEV